MWGLTVCWQRRPLGVVWTHCGSMNSLGVHVRYPGRSQLCCWVCCGLGRGPRDQRGTGAWCLAAEVAKQLSLDLLVLERGVWGWQHSPGSRFLPLAGIRTLCGGGGVPACIRVGGCRCSSLLTKRVCSCRSRHDAICGALGTSLQQHSSKSASLSLSKPTKDTRL
jgi:hypothetical protein